MRGIILIESLVLVCIALNYILKCLEYKNLRELFDNRGKSIKMLNEEVNTQKIRYAGARDIAAVYEGNMDYYKNLYYYHKYLSYEAGDEIKRLKHRVYVLKRDTKCNQRAIVRYKEQNAKLKHTCDEQSRRLEDLRDELLTEKNVAWWYKNWYKVMQNERDAYLYCLRQIQEEVTNAKKE